MLCPSRFTPRKGQLDLIAALRQIASPRPVVVLLGSAHSGSIAYLNKMREQITAHGLDSVVRVLEGIPHRDMPDVYAACDIVVQPSYAEGLGLAALEAMATGRPLLATAVSGFDSFLEHESNALVVPPGEPAAIAKELSRLLSDERLRARLAEQAATDVLAGFDISRTAAEVLAVYGEILGSTKAGDAV